LLFFQRTLACVLASAGNLWCGHPNASSSSQSAGDYE
jgi:hypothetical protein